MEMSSARNPAEALSSVVELEPGWRDPLTAVLLVDLTSSSNRFEPWSPATTSSRLIKEVVLPARVASCRAAIPVASWPSLPSSVSHF
ncbi:MAG: hypothetical protein IIC71_14775 [Acidobacteria bacterium]|nr:hypothetical protein [Acidobacteriota bacterium]